MRHGPSIQITKYSNIRMINSSCHLSISFDSQRCFVPTKETDHNDIPVPTLSSSSSLLCTRLVEISALKLRITITVCCFSSFKVLSQMLQLTLNSCPLVCHCQWFAVLVNHKRFGWRFGIRCLRTSTYQTQRFTGVK